MSGAVVIEEFKPLVRNTLRGFARVRFPSGMIIREICIHTSHGKAWAAPPGRPMVKDGVQLVGSDGNRRWQVMIEFPDKAVRDKWSAQVIEAVRASYPEALAEAPAEDRAA